jgi:sugar (pentulose or hexulose) kinase
VLDAELTGCACVASRALGFDESVGAAAARLVRVADAIEPDSRHRALYEDGFARYREQQALL